SGRPCSPAARRPPGPDGPSFPPDTCSTYRCPTSAPPQPVVAEGEKTSTWSRTPSPSTSAYSWLWSHRVASTGGCGDPPADVGFGAEAAWLGLVAGVLVVPRWPNRCISPTPPATLPVRTAAARTAASARRTTR